MALLGKLYRSRLKQQKELGLLSLEFPFLLVQKQNSAFKLANCDLQINFVFLQITLTIFFKWNLWIKAFLLSEFKEKFLFTFKLYNLLISSKNIKLYTIFLDWDFFCPQTPNWVACSPPPYHLAVGTADVVVGNHFWKRCMVFTVSVRMWYQRHFCFSNILSIATKTHDLI